MRAWDGLRFLKVFALDAADLLIGESGAVWDSAIYRCDSTAESGTRVGLEEPGRYGPSGSFSEILLPVKGGPIPRTAEIGSSGRIRTYDQSVNSRSLYH